MNKKLVSLSLATIIALTCSASVFAADVKTDISKPEQTVINLSLFADKAVIQEISDSVSACLTYADGSTQKIDSTVVIEDYHDFTFKGRSAEINGEKSYKVSVNTNISDATVLNVDKIVSDSGDKNTSNVTASATLQLIWTDVEGVNNKIAKVSGTLTVTKGTVTSGTVKYGDWITSELNWTERNVGASESFSYSPNITAISPAARYYINFKDELFGISLSATSNIIQ